MCFCERRWGVTLHTTGPDMLVHPEDMIEQTGYDFDSWEEAARWAYRFFSLPEQLLGLGILPGAESECECQKSCFPECTCTCDPCVEGKCDYWKARRQGNLDLLVEGVTVALIEHCCEHNSDTTWMVLSGTWEVQK